MPAGEVHPNFSANLQVLYHLTDVNDASANAYTLTNTNTVTFVPGKFGTASSHVQASNQYLNKAAATNANVSTSQTWLSWVRHTSASGDVFYMGFRTNGGSDYKGLGLDTTSGFAYFYGGTTLTPNLVASQNGTIVKNKWHCTIGVYDSSANTLKLFIDGILAGQSTTTGSFQTATSNFSIGAWGNHAVGTNMQGQLDECAIWTRAWSDKEVKNYYAWAKGLRTSTP